MEVDDVEGGEQRENGLLRRKEVEEEEGYERR